MGVDTDLFVASLPAISVAGEDRADLAANLLALVIHEDTQGLYRCEATFGNWDVRNQPTPFLYFEPRTMDFGKLFKVKLGAETLFEGRVMGLEAGFPEARPPEITVLAEDRFQDLRMTRRTRTFADVADVAVIKQIASEHGLGAQVEMSGPRHKILAQINQSDLAFLRERARTNDAELWMDGNTLYAKSRVDRGNGRGAFEISHGKELHEFTALADLATQRSTVSVSGWDVQSKSALQRKATKSTISGELSFDEGGAEILARALGEREEAIAHMAPITNEEADAMVNTYYRAMARRFVVGRGVAETSSKLRVGGSVVITNIGPLFSGKYYLAEVRHLFDLEKGLRTEFTAERPGLGRAH